MYGTDPVLTRDALPHVSLFGHLSRVLLGILRCYHQIQVPTYHARCGDRTRLGIIYVINLRASERIRSATVALMPSLTSDMTSTSVESSTQTVEPSDGAWLLCISCPS